MIINTIISAVTSRLARPVPDAATDECESCREPDCTAEKAKKCERLRVAKAQDKEKP